MSIHIKLKTQIIVCCHPAVQHQTHSNLLNPAIPSRWVFRLKLLDSSHMESYDGHTNKAKEI